MNFDFGIGIDPGTTHTGMAIVDVLNKKLIFAQHVENNDLIQWIGSTGCHGLFLSKNINEVFHKNTLVGIERIISYGKAVGNATLDTAEWVGRFRQEAYHKFAEVDMIRRPDVKVSLCGSVTYRGEKGALKSVTDAMMKHVAMDCFPQTGGGKKPAIGTEKNPGPLFHMPSKKNGGDHCWSSLFVILTALRKRGLYV